MTSENLTLIITVIGSIATVIIGIFALLNRQRKQIMEEMKMISSMKNIEDIKKYNDIREEELDKKLAKLAEVEKDLHQQAKMVDFKISQSKMTEEEKKEHRKRIKESLKKLL